MAAGTAQPRLRDRVRQVIRTRRYSHRMGKSYRYWIRYYIRFHGAAPSRQHRRPRGPAVSEVARDRAARGGAGTRNQALNALVFL